MIYVRGIKQTGGDNMYWRKRYQHVVEKEQVNTQTCGVVLAAVKYFLWCERASRVWAWRREYVTINQTRATWRQWQRQRLW